MENFYPERNYYRREREEVGKEIMKRYFRFMNVIFVICCLIWPRTIDTSSLQSIADYWLPADIMWVEFADEVWTYRLHENGVVKKIVVIRDKEQGNGKHV